MTTEAPAPPDRPKTECTICPPWVIRCAHLHDEEGTIIHLGDWALYTGPRDGSHARSDHSRFNVCVWTDGYSVHCTECQCWAGPWHRILPTRTDDFDAALAAFHVAEERLLRGDV